ncbi:holliday junction resolvase [Gordonia phage Dardanus]|uniref:Holliday junction resolvase n=1 Tax=Gordonia phage Dardanus TaxID=2588489 RepID=A0A514CX55_9CAUD|nr:RusA-like Holliday junction resolvase [Gordonia phage Dardanus]QDH85089.1 holliday junction resolvase [Gordonia phage Dardanus]
MANAMKRKGDAYERVLRDYFRRHGFTDCERTKAGYERDAGDLHLSRTRNGPRVIVQAKDVRTPDWSGWLAGLRAQVDEAGAEVGFIVNKRSRPGKTPLHLAVMPLEQFTDLLIRAGYQDAGNRAGEWIE